MRKVAFSGCRHISITKEQIEAALDEYVGDQEFRIFVGCNPGGVDACVLAYAKKNAIRYDIFYAQWRKFNRAAGPIRNKDMVHEADMLLAFWDGRSAGTESAINAARELDVPYHIIDIEEGTEK